MKQGNWRTFFVALPIMLAGIGIIGGCDSGRNAVDEVTGNRAVKQYHKSKKDISKIADQQAEKYNQIPDEDAPEDDGQ
jgi:hypothetical protein